MGLIKATQRLIVEDFPDQKEWIPKLLSPVNRFLTEAIAAINGGIEFEKNISGMDREFDFNYTSSTFPIGFRWNLSSRPKALSVVQFTEGGVAIIGLVSWEFTAEGQVSLTSAVKITSAPAVASLTANSRYKIRVRVTP